MNNKVGERMNGWILWMDGWMDEERENEHGRTESFKNNGQKNTAKEGCNWSTTDEVIDAETMFVCRTSLYPV